MLLNAEELIGIIKAQKEVYSEMLNNLLREHVNAEMKKPIDKEELNYIEDKLDEYNHKYEAILDIEKAIENHQYKED